MICARAPASVLGEETIQVGCWQSSGDAEAYSCCSGFPIQRDFPVYEASSTIGLISIRVSQIHLQSVVKLAVSGRRTVRGDVMEACEVFTVSCSLHLGGCRWTTKVLLGFGRWDSSFSEFWISLHPVTEDGSVKAPKEVVMFSHRNEWKKRFPAPWWRPSCHGAASHIWLLNNCYCRVGKMLPSIV